MQIEPVSSNKVRMVLSSGVSFMMTDADELGLFIHLPPRQAGKDKIAVLDDSAPRTIVGKFFTVSLRVVEEE
jgi:hypothetical protein